MATEQFHYKTDGGDTVTLPKMENVPGGILRKARLEVRKNDDVGQDEYMWALLEGVLDEDQLDVVDSLGIAEIGRLFDAWSEDSRTSAPESSAS